MTAAIDQGTEGVAGLTFPGFWGMVMARHMHLYGTTREQVAAVTVKNRKFGVSNPLAQFQNWSRLMRYWRRCRSRIRSGVMIAVRRLMALLRWC